MSVGLHLHERIFCTVAVVTGVGICSLVIFFAHVFVRLRLQSSHLGCLSVFIVDVTLDLHERIFFDVAVVIVVGICSLIIFLTHILVRLRLQSSHLGCFSVFIVDVTLDLHERIFFVVAVVTVVGICSLVIFLTHILVRLRLQSGHLGCFSVFIVDVTLDL